MSRTGRVVRNIAIGLAALIVLVLVAGLIIVRTQHFQEYVKQKIVAAITSSTGGVTEIGSFTFDPSHLRAHVENLVIHGMEPAGEPPFLRVAQIDVSVRLFGNGRFLDVAYLGLQRPEANVLVFPNGTTNIPEPKVKSQSNSTALETVVDLAIGQLDLREGMVTFNSRKQPLDIRANHLQVQLAYHLLQHAYQGQVSLEPMYVTSGRNTPVAYRITLPIALERDRIRVQNASITTASSTIHIDGALENLRNPVFTGHVNGRVTLADLRNSTGLPLDISGRGVPNAVDIDASATASSDEAQLKSMTVVLGRSSIDASGTLKGRAAGPLRFEAQLALPELAQLFRVSARPEGTVIVTGNATLSANNDYTMTGHLHSSGLGIQQGSLRIHNAAVSTDLKLTPAQLDLSNLRLAALGGEFAGDAKLQDFAQFQLNGALRNFDLGALAQVAQLQLPYSGTISGPVEASGDLKAPGTRGLEARANLSIAPGRRGMPLQGRLNADYAGSRDDVTIQNSYLALPHTRLTLAGSVQRGLNVSLVSRDLNDLLTAMPAAKRPDISLANGELNLTGAVTGKLAAPQIRAHLAATQLRFDGRQFDSLAADVAAAPSGATVRNGELTRGTMLATFAGSVGMRSWSPGPREPVSADANIANGDVADILAMAGQSPEGYSGVLNAALHVRGTVGNPNGSASLHAMSGTLHGEVFDRLDAQVNLSDQLAVIQSASLIAGNARADLTGEFQHPRDSFTTGRIHARLQTNQIDLSQLRTLRQETPNTSGQVQLTTDVAGTLSQTEFLLTNIQADATARAVRVEGQQYGDLQAHARTSGQNATLDATSNFAGSNLRVHAVTQLVHGYPTTADAEASGLPVERVLAVAHRTDIPVRGMLAASAHVRGTLDHPEGDATLNLTHAVVDDELLDRVQARVNYLEQRIDLPQLEVVAGPSHVNLTARFDHPAGRLDSGRLQFALQNSRFDLARLRRVQEARPGLAGILDLSADGSATVDSGSPNPGSPRILLTSLNATAASTNLAADGQNLGGFNLTARTNSGSRLDFTLRSDVAGANIQATGNGQLGGDYPIDAQLSFGNVKWTKVQSLLSAVGGRPSFEVTTEGRATVSGPILKTEQLRGSVQLAQLQLQTLGQTATRPITIQNQGPITATLDRGTVRLSGFHLTGPQTDIQANGTVAITNAQNVNVSVNAGLDLTVLRSFSREIVSSGNVKLAADVRGTMSDPQMTGSLELHDANLNYLEIPNGLSNANGVIALRGNRASIQNLTAESGGGKITLSGFATMGDNYRFALRANASGVRVRIQDGVSLMADADVRLNGILQNSTATGTVTLEQLTYAPQSDLGSVLTRAAPPVQSPTTPSPLLENMKLDIRVRTSPAMRVQSSLAENLQTDADLRVRGTATQPSVLGRVLLTSGKLVFFGSTYTVNSGSISFFNPVRIEPVLNISLETLAKGVDVILNVTGPVDNMKLTYTSDPPLQFQEIAALLSSGTAPVSDPTLLARQPPPPEQSIGQRGESAIMSQAIANPIAGRLQRVFGVSQLKIDPSFTGSSALPTAQLTLQQQVSNNITFTYISALDNPNSTLIRAEWALNPRWSATAVRDQNGIFSINLLYKKHFH
jgi:translocation and assembly module TamB